MSGGSAPAAAAEEAPGWMAPERKGRGSSPPPPLKKKPGSLRRAFSWLRGKRKKPPQTPPEHQQEPPPGAEGSKKRQARAKGKGAAKAENEKRQSVQYKAGDDRANNAFFSTSRPPHLEALHIQAQAGLKSLQNQEKQKHGKQAWDHSDTCSLQSSRSSVEGDDVSLQSQALSCTTETTSEDALSVRSEMIQRKGSTFRPHDSFPKSSAKGEKRRRERRTTVLGLPSHVQKELGLSNGYDAKKGPGRTAARGSPTSPQPLANGGQGAGNAILIPTIDGKTEPHAVPEGGARVSLPALEVEAADNALQGHIDRVYYDDSLVGRKTAGKLSPLARPKSLAVPWMTTRAPGSPELLSPVMSISPQGTYMSKIIPNAILPPLVDVIALSRDRVRTLSRCSLATASPSPSARSVGRFPAGPRSREHSSSSDNWSHSQSTETIVSNTSTISSHGGSRKGGAGPPDGRGLAAGAPEPDKLSTYSSRSGASSAMAHPAKVAPASPSLLGVRPLGGSSSGRASPAYSTGSAADGSDSMSVRSDRSSARSVSLRKMKKAPAPPRRTYSLHQKAQQLEAEGAPKAMGLPPKPGRRPQREGGDPWAPAPRGSPSLAGEDDVFSPSSPSDAGSLACSPDLSLRDPTMGAKLHEAEGVAVPEALEVSSKHSSPDHFGRTMSPSSGYSSQSGTPTLHAKSPVAHACSPGKKRPQPKKPDRVCSLQSPGGLSVSSSLTSLSSSASDPAPAEASAGPPAGAPLASAPALNKTDRFVIPPHPKVPAPSCPPPTQNQPAGPRVDNATVAASASPDQTGKEQPPGALVKTSHVASPPPSPPPAYHPPPPPLKKADGIPEPPGVAAGPPPSGTEADGLPDPLWPPPPPPMPDTQDLSMANFPPPDDTYFPPPAPGCPSVEVEAPTTAAAAAAAEAPGGPSPTTEEQPATSKATPAEWDQAAVASPSFFMMVSCKSQRQSTPEATPPPAPKIDPPPPPLPPPTPTGKPHGSFPAVAPQKAHEPGPASPAGLQAPANLKKPANGGKGSPAPKEEAHLPIVTPSLLQMVRLRSVHMDAQGPAAGPGGPPEPNGPCPSPDGKQGPPAPQKPIRKSLSLRVTHSAPKDAGAPNALHEAVRSKASTLTTREAPGFGAPGRKRMTLPAFPAPTAAPLPLLAGEAAQDGPLLKSPASTASFIFAKSPKKVVLEAPSSAEAQANLKKNLVVELMNVSSQRSLAAPGPHPPGGLGKPPKVPPPIAKKPSLGPGSLHPPRSPRGPSSPLPAPLGERTKDEGAGGPATDARRNGSGAVPEAPQQSPPAQDLREKMA